MEIKYEKLISESSAPYFTRQNLEILLGTNRRTLDYRIGSLIRRGILTRMKPGVYVNATLLETTPSPEELLSYIGCQLVPNSYLSLEYALSVYGILAESVYEMTYVTTRKTRKFSSGSLRFTYRNIKPDLFSGYVTKNYQTYSYVIATPAKALFDFLYFTPFETVVTMREFINTARINWDSLTKKDTDELKYFIRVSASKKLNTLFQILTKKGVL